MQINWYFDFGSIVNKLLIFGKGDADVLNDKYSLAYRYIKIRL